MPRSVVGAKGPTGQTMKPLQLLPGMQRCLEENPQDILENKKKNTRVYRLVGQWGDAKSQRLATCRFYILGGSVVLDSKWFPSSSTMPV